MNTEDNNKENKYILEVFELLKPEFSIENKKEIILLKELFKSKEISTEELLKKIMEL